MKKSDAEKSRILFGLGFASYFLSMFGIAIVPRGFYVFVGILALAFASIIVSFRYLIRANKAGQTDFVYRPIVHVWEHNGVTAVCTDIDYDLWEREKERGLLVSKDWWSNKIPFPTYTAFFSDDPFFRQNYPEYLTGSMGDLEKIKSDCQVRKSELWVPRKEWGDYALKEARLLPVNLQNLHNLIHG